MMDDGGDDEFHLDQVDDPTSQPRPSKKQKLKKVDNHHPDDGGPSQEIDIEGKNTFQVQVILDIVFKMLSFEDVKKFRLVSSTWNQVGSSELFRRPQKFIMFHNAKELGQDDTLGQLIELQKSHKDLFGADHQLFSNFSINIALLKTEYYKRTNTIFDNFFEFFKPSFVQLYGSLYQEEEEVEDNPLHLMCKFLVQISPTIQEIDFNNFYTQFIKKGRVVDTVIEELTRTKFPNLRKITNNTPFVNFQKMFFYPIIGQNSPKLAHLSFKKVSFFGTAKDEEFKSKFESSGLMSKLKTLDLLDVGTELLDILAELGQRGQLKLTKLTFKNEDSNSKRIKNIFVRLIASQGDSLKILKISTSYQSTMYKPPPNTIIVPYPRLQNLTSLQIDYFSTFQSFFEPINFSRQFPKLEEFRTFDFDTFYNQDFGKCGDSVKFVSFLSHQLTCFDKRSKNFDKIYEIFPNLEFLQVDRAFLPIKFSWKDEENPPFWPRLRKLQIHCNKLKDLYYFGLHEQFLKDVKKIEVVVECGNTLALEDSYKNSLSQTTNDGPKDFDNLRREKLYQKCLKSISQDFSSIIHLTSISFIGYKISEDFKRDFRSIFPDSTFVSCQFKKTKD